MATIAVTTAGEINVVQSREPNKTLPASVAVLAGQFVRETSAGKWEIALATSAGAAAGARMALRSVAAGESLSAMRSGIVSGFTVTQAFNASVYVGDTGLLVDTAGTATVIAGRVYAGTANAVTAAHDKLIELDLPV